MRETRAIHVAEDLEALSQQAARFVAETVAAAVAARGRCTLALAGGTTPRRTYELLAAPPLREAVPWEAVHLFWGDERCVPPDHPDSNYRLVRESLLAHIAIPPPNVHRVPTEIGPPAVVAAHYERELRGHFALEVTDVPQFDLILLGMGADGHTASLFPGSPALEETRRLVVPSRVEYLPHERVTLTLPVLNAARVLAFLVAGADKAPALTRALAGDPAVPAARVRPAAGAVHWYVDRAAWASDT
ncbi:MAG TPA: 6-phosphogluconolactonase [Chloroflexota bacterium]|nr:6-phosphogluconolactonase [Chloroflexota bacterium]